MFPGLRTNRKILFIDMKKFFLSVAAAVLMGTACPQLARAQQEMRTIEIGMLSTTHVLFTSDLTYVDISSQEVIAAKVVDASKNMLAIKARKEFAFTTTISALEANGTMHTFYVRYNANPSALVIDTRQKEESVVAQVNTQIRPEQAVSSGSIQYQQPAAQQQQPAQSGKSSKKNRRGRNGNQNSQPAQSAGTGVTVTTSQTSNFGRTNAPTLEEVMRKDQEVFHVVDKIYRLEAACVNVYAYSDLTYIVLTLKNGSDIGYEAGDAQFTVENKKVSSKTLSTDKSVWPKSSYGTLSCAPNSVTKIGYTIPKLTLQKNEVLKIYIYEKGGNRNLFLVLDDKDVNYAVSPI